MILQAAISIAMGMSLAAADAIEPLPEKLPYFPVSTQFSPVPSGPGWHGEEGPLSEEVLKATVDNIRAHGITGIEFHTGRPEEEQEIILQYAQSIGMFIAHHTGPLEGFGRDAPPEISVLSDEYAHAVRARAEERLAPVADIPRLYNVFTFQDEPFHVVPGSFDYSEPARKAFEERYGYDMPQWEDVQGKPERMQDLLNFQSEIFAIGWQKTYDIVKSINPGFKVTMTHDSHNTLGGGAGSHSVAAIDDVFYWGGDFADIFVFDIYPYVAGDFRFGRPSEIYQPRMAMAHYTFAQMRNLCRATNSDMGFWVGTFNPTWFSKWLDEDIRKQYWSEREMSTTAVAHGADYLLTGYKIPTDAKHWESFGEGLNLIQKAGGALLDAPKLQAKACMLFPRTHYLLSQQEYFNVGLTFELFQRAFGELDILHEEQIPEGGLEAYEILLLADVSALREQDAERIAQWVKDGGTIIADAIPHLNEKGEPLAALTPLWGAKGARADRVFRTGHFEKFEELTPRWYYKMPDAPDEDDYAADQLAGEALGVQVDIPLVSVRMAEATGAEVLLETQDGRPGLTRNAAGKGRLYLLPFSLQDTYFQTWWDDRPVPRAQLRELLWAITQDAGAAPHVRSSNPGIEAAVRANEREAFLFLINHEQEQAETAVVLHDLPFKVRTVVNLADGAQVDWDGKRLDMHVPLGETRILALKP